MFRASSQSFFGLQGGLTSTIAGIVISCLIVPTLSTTTEFLQSLVDQNWISEATCAAVRDKCNQFCGASERSCNDFNTCDADGELIKFYLIGCTLPAGTVPPLSLVPSLNVFYLDSNGTSERILGSVPSLSANKDLRTLQITGDMTGTLPSVSANPLLISLQIKGDMTGTLPSVSANPFLFEYIIWGNLTGTIPSLTSNSELTKFSISGTLTGTIPNLAANKKLQSLVLGNNRLTGAIPDLSAYTNLWLLVLSNNLLSATGPPNSLPESSVTFTGEIFCYVSGNPFTYIAPEYTTEALYPGYGTNDASTMACKAECDNNGTLSDGFCDTRNPTTQPPTTEADTQNPTTQPPTTEADTQEVEVTFVNQPPNTFLRATLLPQPNRDTDNNGTVGFPVVEIVLVDSQTGATVSVDDDPSNEIVFFLPVPTTPPPTVTRAQLESLGACIKGKLQRDELSCQWLDTNTNSWSSKGCILSYVDPSTNANGASHKCTCSHLTVFTIQNRKVEITNTFGLSGAGLYVSLAVFCSLMAAVACVIYHWRKFPESEPLAVVYFVAGWVGVGSDLLLVRYLGQAASGCGETGAFLTPFSDGILAVTLYSIFVNGLLNSWFIWIMANNKIDISRWIRSHKKQVAFIWLVALPAPSILNLLGSKLFGIQKDFPAVSGQNDQRFPLLSKLSIVNMVFEDIPQLAIGIAMAANFGAFSGLQQLIVALKCIYIFTCSFKAFYTAAWCRAIAFVKVLVTSCAKASLKQLNSIRKSKKLTRLNNAELPSQALAKIDLDAPVDDADAVSDVDSTGGASDNKAA